MKSKLKTVSQDPVEDLRDYFYTSLPLLALIPFSTLGMVIRSLDPNHLLTPTLAPQLNKRQRPFTSGPVNRGH